MKSIFKITLAAGLLIPWMALAQEAAVPAAKDAGGDSMLYLILHSGNPLTIIVWLSLLATSIIMMTFIIQNIITLRLEKLAPPALVDALSNEIQAGNYQEAWETCNANRNYLANVLRAGLERLGRGKGAVEDAISEHALREAQILRVRNSYLSVIGVVSPMIGLLGTVIGMIGAFRTMGANGLQNPQGLSSAIGEVLLATASGLFIAIPAFIAYYFFRNRAQLVIVHADDAVNNLVMDLPYEELAGMQIGEKFSAGAGAPDIVSEEARRVSMTLTTNCPVCNGSVTPGVNPCPHCGATLQWAK